MATAAVFDIHMDTNIVTVIRPKFNLKNKIGIQIIDSFLSRIQVGKEVVSMKREKVVATYAGIFYR